MTGEFEKSLHCITEAQRLGELAGM